MPWARAAGLGTPGLWSLSGSDLHRVLIDGRHAEARALGARFSRAATPVSILADGDVTQLWRDEIGPAWRGRPVAIAGLTEQPALFCLEQLGLSGGLRVVFHGEHVTLPDGRVGHTLLRGAEDAGLSARDLTRAGPLWPARLAAAWVLHRRQARPRRVGPSHAALEPVMAAGARWLTSWIIAAV